MILSDDPARGRLWIKAAGAALAIHAGAVGAMLVRISSTADPSLEQTAVAIDMAPLVTAPPAPVHDAPTPERVEAPKTEPERRPDVKKAPFDPPPELKVSDAKPEVVVPKKEEQKPSEEKPNSLPPAPTTTRQAAPEVKQDAKVAAAVTGGANAGTNNPVDAWYARVTGKIQLMKRYPAPAASKGQQDEVNVSIVVDRRGRLLTSHIEQSRGFALLDEATLDAVRLAAPFPRPPAEIGGDVIKMSVILRFFKKERR